MDISELLKIKPQVPALKRQGDDAPDSSDTSDNRLAKQPRVEIADAELYKLEANDGEEDDIKAVDESTFSTYCSQLEKRARLNQEARTKFADQPEKFMNSELDLQETLDSMQILASEPAFYKMMVPCTQILSSLISHDNTDMSLTLIDLLNALLDYNGLLEAPEDSVNVFLDSLLNVQVVQLLTQNLARLSEESTDESQGIFKTIGIMESLVEVRPTVIGILHEQGFFDWLIQFLHDKNFTKNRLYASELLDSILLLDAQTCLMLGEKDGIDILLQKLSAYKRHDPVTYEEAEMMQNLFNCVCTCLMYPVNQERFLQGEGIQLMNLMLREHHLARDTALRVLDYAFTLVQTSSAEDEMFASQVVTKNCVKFVEILGLRTIFPLFMHGPKSKMLKFTKKVNEKKAAIGPSSEQMEEHIIMIIANLLRFCPSDHKMRVLNKFIENDHEKIDRTVELHQKYWQNMQDIERKIASIKETGKWEALETEEVNDKIATLKMDAGQLTLQMIDLIMLEVCVNGPESIERRLFKLLKMKNIKPATIAKNCEDYINNLGDDPEVLHTISEYLRVRNLLDRFTDLSK